MKTPRFIESRISYLVIADLLNFEILTDLYVPSIICPYCKSSRTFILKDFSTNGYRWYCPKCNYSYTSLQFYQEYRKLPNLNIAWHNLEKESGMSLGGVDAAPMISELHDLLSYEQELYTTIDIGKKYLSNHFPSNAVNSLSLRDWWSPFIQNNYLSTYDDMAVCISSRAYTYYLQNKFKDKSRVNFNKKDCLCVPFELGPYQYSSVFLTDEEGRESVRELDKAVGPGLLGFKHSFNTDNFDRINVFCDIDIFFKQMRLWLDYNEQRANIVCAASPLRNGFPDISKAAFENLPHKQVVFWDKGRNVEILNMARAIGSGRAKIAPKPYVAEDDSRFDTGISIYFKNYLERCDPVEWYEALNAWLGETKKRDIVSTRAILNQLSPSLTEKEMEELKSVAGRQAITLLNEWAGATATAASKSAIVDGVTYVAKQGYGVFAYKDGNENLITDCIVKMEESMDIGGDIYITGRINFSGEEIPFTLTLDSLRNNFIKVISDKCAAIVGVPQFLSSYKDVFFDVFMDLYKPKAVDPISKVGWLESDALYRFPQFDIKEGKVAGVRKSFSGNILPGSSISPKELYPNKLALKKLVEVNAENVLVFGQILHIATNLALSHWNKTKYSMSLLGDRELTGTAVNFVGELLSLKSYGKIGAIESAGQAIGMEELIEEEHRHDFPVITKVYSLKSPNWIDWFLINSPHNCIMVTPIREVFSLLVQNNWTFLNCEYESNEFIPYEELNYFKSFIPLYLQQLQQDNYQQDGKALKDYYAIYNHVCDYAVESFLKDDALVSEIQNRIVQPHEKGYERLLYCLFFLIANNTLQIQGKTDKYVALKKEGGYYHINWNKITKIDTSRHFMLLPEVDHVNEAFEDSKGEVEFDTYKSIWKVKEETWNAVFDYWLEKFGYQLDISDKS